MTKKPSSIGVASPDDPRPSFLAFLDWLPWEKILIWSLFLLVVYSLRHFFFIIFMTFILTYVMLRVVKRIAGIVLPNRESVWLERGLTLLSFAALLFGLYMAGSFIVPRLLQQGEALVARFRYVDPNTDYNTVLNRLVGPFVYEWEYEDETSEKYQEEFNRYVAKFSQPVADYHGFQATVASLERDLDIRIVTAELKAWSERRQRIGEDGLRHEFERWFVARRAPEIYNENREHYQAEWKQWYEFVSESLNLPPLEEFVREENFESARDEQIYRMIARKRPLESPEEWARERKQFEDDLGREAVALVKDSIREKEFESYYDGRRTDNPDAFPYEYDVFAELREALKDGETGFAEKVEELGLNPKTDEERAEQARRAFRTAEEKKLTKAFLSQGLMAKVVAAGEENLGKGFDLVFSKVQGWIPGLVQLPVTLALSFLLSLFFTFDIARIRKGVQVLQRSRVSGFYHEIAPGLINFGRLIGRAFQAQGVIAFFNTLLTYLAIIWLGIDNEWFLCVIVFVCSFIPVLGVVLSSVPIAIMALVQPGGDVFLAGKIVIAILLIHFLETSLLNPKILGDMLHLHPVLVLAVLAIGEHFFGVWGLLLGVPVTVYVIRCVVLGDGIPGLIEPTQVSGASPAVALLGPGGTGNVPPAATAAGAQAEVAMARQETAKVGDGSSSDD